MSKPALQALVQQLRRVAVDPAMAEPLNQVLLEQFFHGGDEAASAQILRRHEPRVRRTC